VVVGNLSESILNLMVDPATIERIREANPIEDVIGEFLTLEKVGKQYRALCPFHPDTKPSFYISPDKGVYHCFGCGKSGNVFTFLQDYKGMSFIEALHFLAERAGISLDLTRLSPKVSQQLTILEEAANFYHKMLRDPKGRTCYEYLKSRGVDETAIEHFMLGCAPSGYVLVPELSKRYSLATLIEVGLATQDDKGVWDFFRNRIIFPVRNTFGRVIGFSSRIIDVGEPKYLNSPDTPVFHKKKALYGMYENRDAIRREGMVYLVEGNLDLISLWQHGIRNVVATLGTALTPEQALVIKRYTDKVVILYDADDAGHKAASRAIDILLAADLDVYVKLLPEGEDPDTYIKVQSVDEFNALPTLTFVEYRARDYHNKPADEKIKILQELRVSLHKIKDRLRRTVWVDEASKLLNISREILEEPPESTSFLTVSAANRDRLEAEILGLAARDEALLQLIRMKMAPEDFVPSLQNVATLIFQGKQVGEIFHLIESDTLRACFARTLFMKIEADITYETLVDDYLRALRRLKIKERMQMLKSQLEEDPTALREYQRLAEEYQQLLRKE